MTGVRELVEVRVITAAPEHVRLSFLGGPTQLDVSLPLDAPIASLLPQLVQLVRSREKAADAGDDATVKEAKRDFWVVERLDGTPLSPDATLRESGVANGELLRLNAERALAPPTLYDDVVDAAARLNRAAYVSWNPLAARWMAFAGAHLATAAWVYLLLVDAVRPARAVIIGVATVVAVTLVGVAALATRSYGRRDVGAALGWAAVPIFAAVAWALLSAYNGYVVAGGCAALVVVVAGCHRAIGTGHFAYLAAGLVFALSGIAFAVRAAGVDAAIVGVGLAVLAAVACLAVGPLTTRLAWFEATTVAVDVQRGEQALFENPFVTAEAQETETEAAPPPIPTAEEVWARVRSVTLTRAGLYAGLAASAALGAADLLEAQRPLAWSGFAFAWVVAVTIGLSARRPATTEERLGMGVPALLLAGYVCASAQSGPAPMPLVAFAVLLVGVVAFAVVAARGSERRTTARQRAVLAYLEYLAVAALLPLALWAIGAYGRLGIT